ncbi:succinate dehydrogenase assembly factor 2 [Alphaproteobacteria bacterium]|nr:succinate dehydrogenase assembly factor 2 [Alphaproteobacteria bacterium]
MKKYKNKLKYRSWHRGTKEADLFLGSFFDKYSSKMTQQDLALYEKFLNLVDDNELLYIVKGKKKWGSNFPAKIVILIEEFIKSEDIR